MAANKQEQDMIELSNAEKALHYLGETDVEFGKAKANMNGSKERLKTEYARAYLQTNNADKVDERKSHAYISNCYGMALKAFEDSTLDFEILKNKRLRAELTIEMWRSINSAKSKGVMT